MMINFVNFMSFAFIFILMLMSVLIATDLFDDFSSSGAIITIIVCFIILISSGYYIFFIDLSSNEVIHKYIESSSSPYLSQIQSMPQQQMLPLQQQMLPQQQQMLPQQQQQMLPQQQQQILPQQQQILPDQTLVQAPTSFQAPAQMISSQVQPETYGVKYYSKIRELNNNIKKMLNTMNK
jgi:hypothetical protein